MSLTLNKQNHYRERYAAMRPGWQPATDHYETAIRVLIPTLNADPVQVLDMGCGRGGVLEQLQDLPLDAIGIDPDLDSLREHRLPHLKRALAHSEGIPLPDASVHLVISAWVLEHLPEPQRTFAEVARVLQPGGAFVFLAPNKNSPISWLNRTLKPLQSTLVPLLYGRAEADTFPVQYRASTKDQLENLAQGAGLTLTTLYHIADPTYLAFNGLFFRLNVLMSDALPQTMRVHLVGICRKEV